MNLRLQPAKPRATRRKPRYPVAAAVVLATVSGCYASEPPVLPRAPRCSDSKEGVGVSPEGLADVRSAPPFAADHPRPEKWEARFFGGIPSPYEMHLREGDARRIEARIGYCVRAARARGPIPETTLELRAWVRKDGRATCDRAEVDPKRPDLSTCVRELVRTAEFETDEIGDRRVAGEWTIGPESHVAKR